MFLHNCLLVCALILLVLFTQACYSLKQVGSPTPESIEITNAEHATTIGHFERTKTIHHFIFGLVSPDDVGIEKLVSDEVQLNGGTGAVNVRINYQMTFLNGLVYVITFGIYSPFTLTVEGDVVK